MNNAKRQLHHILARTCALFGIIISFGAIAGYSAGIGILINWNPKFPGMALPTAVTLLLLSASCFLLSLDYEPDRKPPTNNP